MRVPPGVSKRTRKTLFMLPSEELPGTGGAGASLYVAVMLTSSAGIVKVVATAFLSVKLTPLLLVVHSINTLPEGGIAVIVTGSPSKYFPPPKPPVTVTLAGNTRSIHGPVLLKNQFCAYRWIHAEPVQRVRRCSAVQTYRGGAGDDVLYPAIVCKRAGNIDVYARVIIKIRDV